MLSNARKRWSGISSTAWSNAKSVWRGTSKWFGNAYGSLRGWMNNMTKKSRDKWDSISSTAWSNAKSVWRGTSKWFSNAYGSLKGWMNNMSKKLMINGITFHPLHGAMLNRFGEALRNGLGTHTEV